MLDAIIDPIRDFLARYLGEELCVIICSMLPIIELRGAIPMAAFFKLPGWQAYLFSVLGNMLPVPIILLFIRKFLTWAASSKIKFLNRLANWLNRKVEKNRPKIEKYAFWGLCIFIAIPLPTTGAWTGSLVAAMIDMKFWKAMLTAFVGVLIAGVIVTVIVYVGIGALSWLV